MTRLESLVLLNMVEGIGSVRTKKLIETFRDPSCVFEASVHELTATGILDPPLAKGICEAPRRFNVRREIEEAGKKGARIITLFDEDYPRLLKEIYDPPYVLYVKGQMIPADDNSIGIVGSRGASFYGLSCAGRFSAELSQYGLTVVSGMARGIDTVAHRAALDAGGRTIAVLGSGLNKIYPAENEGLFQRIVERGAVISQFCMDRPPLAQNFPIRNRIISGMSQGVLVVEASAKSGALITARYALEQDREVFAVPGKVTSATSSGTHDLIKQGARMVTEAREILEELRPHLSVAAVNTAEEDLSVARKGPLSAAISGKEALIVGTLGDEPKYIDRVSQDSGLSIQESMAILVQLELKGIVRQLPGKQFVKFGHNLRSESARKL